LLLKDITSNIFLKNGKKIITSYLLDKGLISKIYKELKKFIPKGQIIELVDAQMNRQFSKEVKNHKWVHKEMFNRLCQKGKANQNDTEIPSHPSQNDIIKKTSNNKCWQ
jgi:hypothetical protein